MLPARLFEVRLIYTFKSYFIPSLTVYWWGFPWLKLTELLPSLGKPDRWQ